jgi:hypothetical protein
VRARDCARDVTRGRRAARLGIAWTEVDPGGVDRDDRGVKNIQIIDGAMNCTYSIFAAPDHEFAEIFPGDTDVAFPDEIRDRLGEARAGEIVDALWDRPVMKNAVQGIHGTIFYELDYKKDLYPTRREDGMDPRAYNVAQRRQLRIG